jgi:hypothetical protein
VAIDVVSEETHDYTRTRAQGERGCAETWTLFSASSNGWLAWHAPRSTYLHNDVRDLRWCRALLTVGPGPVWLPGVVHVERERHIVDFHGVVDRRLRVRLRRACMVADKGSEWEPMSRRTVSCAAKLQHSRIAAQIKPQAVGKSDMACKAAHTPCVDTHRRRSRRARCESGRRRWRTGQRGDLGSS